MRVAARCSGFAWDDADRRPRDVSVHVVFRNMRRSGLDRTATLSPLDPVVGLKESEARAEDHSAVLMGNHLAKRHVVLAALSLALLAILCLSPSLFGKRVAEAWSGLDSADPRLLWIAGIAFAGMTLCTAMSWRSALRAS